MSHTETRIEGKDCPSVTDISGILDKSFFLVPWASKHGTTKVEALIECLALSKDDIKLQKEILEKYELDPATFFSNHDDIGKLSRERGSWFHKCVEEAISFKYGLKMNGRMKDDELVRVEDAEKYVPFVSRWCERVGLKPLFLEQYYQSKEYLFGGTADLFGIVGDILTVVDWKLTGQISKSFPIQMAGYGVLYAENNAGIFPKEGRIIRPYQLSKEAKIDEVKVLKNSIKHTFKGSNIFIEEKHYPNLEEYKQHFLALRKIYDIIKE